MHKQGHFCYLICNLGQKSSHISSEKGFAYGGNSKIVFLDHFSASFVGQNYQFYIHIQFWARKRSMNMTLEKRMTLPGGQFSHGTTKT